MSSSPLDMPILISQLPNVQQLLGPQHMPHEAQKYLFGQIVAEKQRKEEQTVQEVDKNEGLDAMGRDSGGNKNASQHAPRPSRPKSTPDQDQPASPGPQSSNASPWSGNIINVKI
jgi:hypothetical protein